MAVVEVTKDSKFIKESIAMSKPAGVFKNPVDENGNEVKMHSLSIARSIYGNAK